MIQVRFILVILFLNGVLAEANSNKTIRQKKTISSLPPLNIKPKSNILFFIGMAVHSHRTAIEPLAHALVARGHNVTFLTPIKPTKPNPKIHEVSTKSLDKFYTEVMCKLGDNYFIPRLKDKYKSEVPNPMWHKMYTEIGADLLFNSPEFKPWLNSSSFDLVIIEDVLSKHGHAIAYKFNAPTILYTPAGFWGHDEETFGIPSESSWLPNYFLLNVFTEKLTFYDKVYSTLYPFYHKIRMEWSCIPRLDELARNALELPDMPSILELEKETSLLFTNLYFSNDYARSLPPSVIQVGGLHCQESNGTLPNEMEEFIAGAGEHGFIFISFGSIINMSAVPDYLIKILFDAIKSFKTRFLWKWDVENPKNLPSNVFAAKWFPQQDVLAHRKIKGFITHGGLMSTQQAIFHGVPMIVLPVVADEPYNAKTISYHKNGLHLELSELTTEILRDAISKLIKSPMFTLNAKRASDLFKDRPMPALDTAVYWTEYVLRHKHTPHMKSPAMNQSWWERRLLDVWLFLLCCSLIFVIIIYKTLKTLIKLSFSSGMWDSESEEKKLK